jgi:hypothetical protein
MDEIKELEQKIETLQNGKAVNNSIWLVLDENMKGISGAEAAAINARETVKTAQADMMYAFVNFFLFAKYRDEFASIPAFRAICNKYITEVVNAKEEGVKHAIELEEENKRLKEELARLKK